MVLPYKFSFVKGTYFLWDAFDFLLDVFFFVDLILTFFTPVPSPQGKLQFGLLAIAKTYLKFWFWMDFFSVIPLDMILSSGNFSIFLKFSKLPRLYKIAKITKVFRSVKSMRGQNSFWSKLYDLLRLNPGLDRLALNLFSIFLFCHIFACIWHFFAELSSGTSSWIWRLELQDRSGLERYLASLYWIIQTVITVGYGDVGAESTAERLIAIFAMFAGVIFFSLTIGSISSLISDSDAKNTAYEAKLSLLLRIKSKYEIDDKTFNNVQRALKFGIYRVDETAVEFVSTLPEQLRIEASAFIYKDTVKDIKFFKGASKEFIASICPHLKEVKFNSGEIIYKKEDYASELFFIKKGMVSLMLKEFDMMPFSLIYEGYHFGEFDLLFSETRNWTTMAYTDVELLALEKIHFQKIVLHKFRRLGTELRQKAEDRMKRQLEAQEQAVRYYKMFGERAGRRRVRRSSQILKKEDFEKDVQPFVLRVRKNVIFKNFFSFENLIYNNNFFSF